MAQKITIFPADENKLFDEQTILDELNGNQSYRNTYQKLLTSCNKVLTWKDKLIAINEFSENGNSFRVAVPICKTKKSSKQFSFGGYDKQTGEIFLFFNAGQDKAKSRAEAFFYFRQLTKICQEHYPNVVPFAIKL